MRLANQRNMFHFPLPFHVPQRAAPEAQSSEASDADVFLLSPLTRATGHVLMALRLMPCLLIVITDSIPD